MLSSMELWKKQTCAFHKNDQDKESYEGDDNMRAITLRQNNVNTFLTMSGISELTKEYHHHAKKTETIQL